MMVTQKGVPYPIVVPEFPIITTDDRLIMDQNFDRRRSFMIPARYLIFSLTIVIAKLSRKSIEIL